MCVFLCKPAELLLLLLLLLLRRRRRLLLGCCRLHAGMRPSATGKSESWVLSLLVGNFYFPSPRPILRSLLAARRELSQRDGRLAISSIIIALNWLRRWPLNLLRPRSRALGASWVGLGARPTTRMHTQATYTGRIRERKPARTRLR